MDLSLQNGNNVRLLKAEEPGDFSLRLLVPLLEAHNIV